jgi:hypothetical protein
MCECVGACFRGDVKPLATALLNPVEAVNAQLCMRIVPRPWFSLDGVNSLPKVAAHPGEATMPNGLTSAKAYCNEPELGGCLTNLGETSFGGVSLSMGPAQGTQAVAIANRYGVSYTLDTTTSYNASCVCVAKGADCVKGAISAKTSAPGPGITTTCVGYVLFSGNCVSNNAARDDRFINCQEKCAGLNGVVNRAFWGTFPGVTCGRPDRESANVCECLLPRSSSSCNGGERWFPGGVPGMTPLLSTSSTSSTTLTSALSSTSSPTSSSAPTIVPVKRSLEERQAIAGKGVCTGWYRNSFLREPIMRNFSPQCTNLDDMMIKCRSTCTTVANSNKAVDSWQILFGGSVFSVPGILSDGVNGSPAGVACWDEGDSGKRKVLWCQCLTKC